MGQRDPINSIMNTGIIVATTTSNISTYQQSVQDCLQLTHRFSETLYTNICIGTQYAVPNGFWDYVASLGIAAICLSFILFCCVALVVAMARDY